MPGKVSQIFLNGNILPKDVHVQSIAFSSDGNELYLSTSDQNWKYKSILHSRFKNNSWTKVDTVEFAKKRVDVGEPFVYGKSVFFVSFLHSNNIRQTDIYSFTKDADEKNKVVHLPSVINSPSNEWHPTFTDNGSMYFASERNNERFQADIYRSNFINGIFGNAVKLSDSINSAYNDGDPLISPDEKFLIFHSERPGGFGGHDLYISFRQTDGSWTKARNMGATINTLELEFGPSLSSDGKYLFFTRRSAFQTETPSKILWVSIAIVEDLK